MSKQFCLNALRIVVFSIVLLVIVGAFIGCVQNPDSAFEYDLLDFADVNKKIYSEKYNLYMSLKMKSESEVARECSVVLEDGENNVIFTTSESYRLRDTLLVTWDDTEKAFWVYSGDLGTFIYEENNGKWIKRLRETEPYPTAYIKLDPEKYK